MSGEGNISAEDLGIGAINGSTEPQNQPEINNSLPSWLHVVTADSDAPTAENVSPEDAAASIDSTSESADDGLTGQPQTEQVTPADIADTEAELTVPSADTQNEVGPPPAPPIPNETPTATPAPESPAAPTTEQTVQRVERETGPEAVRTSEVQMVTNSILMDKYRGLKTITTPTELELNTYAGLRSLALSHEGNTQKDGKNRAISLNNGGSSPAVFYQPGENGASGKYTMRHTEGGVPVRVLEVNNKKTVSVEGKNIDVFVCKISGSNTPAEIPTQVLLDAQMVVTISTARNERNAQSEPLFNTLFTPDEQQFITAHISESVTGDKEPSRAITQEQIKALAEKNGLTTAEDWKTFVTKVNNQAAKRDPDPSNTDAMTPEKLQEINNRNKQAEELIKLLDGKTLASPEDKAMIIATLGLQSVEQSRNGIKDKIDQLIQKKEAVERTLRERTDFSGEAARQHNDLQTQINEMRNLLDQHDQMETFLKENKGKDFTEGFFREVEIGVANKSDVLDLQRLLGEGNIDKVVEKFAEAELKRTLTPEEIKGITGKLKNFANEHPLLTGISAVLAYALLTIAFEGMREE